MSPRHIDRSSPYAKARMPVPPAAARFDAVFVHAVGQLAERHLARSPHETHADGEQPTG